MKDNTFSSTLSSIKIVLRWEPLLAAFTASAIVLIIETLILLRRAQAGSFSVEISATMTLTQSLVFLVFCWGYYSVSHEVDTSLRREKRTTFFQQIRHCPGSYIILPLVFAGLFYLVFVMQTGIIAMIERFELPIWLFSFLYVFQFAIAIINILVFFYFLGHLFLWYPHIRNRTYRFRALLKSFNSIIKEKTYQTFLLTFLWTVITALAFAFILFPLWKITTKETLSASEIALSERFESEITGHNTLLSCIISTIKDDSLTPQSTLGNLRKKLGKLESVSNGVDPYNVKKIPTAGLFFLTALVLTLALPFAVALLIFSSAGNFSYHILTLATSKQKSSRVLRPATPTERSRLKESVGGEKEHPGEEDTIIEVIPSEPVEMIYDDLLSFETVESSVIDSIVDDEPQTSISREEIVDKYVNYDYESPASADESIVFSRKIRKNDNSGGTSAFPDESNKPSFKRETKKQVAPKKKPKDDREGDYTIFDDM